MQQLTAFLYRACIGIIVLFSLGAPSFAVPSFARQTGMACEACHTDYPEPPTSVAFSKPMATFWRT